VQNWSDHEQGIQYTDGDVTIGSDDANNDLVLYGEFEAFDNFYVHGDATMLSSLEIGRDNDSEYSLEIHGAAFASEGWFAPSDRRLKKAIAPITGALDDMLQLAGVSYEWKQGIDGRHMGMIAQEVETLFPEWVKTDADGFKAVSYEGFEALTVEAFREMKQENEQLRTELDELKALVMGRQAAGMIKNADELQDDSEADAGVACGIGSNDRPALFVLVLIMVGFALLWKNAIRTRS
jgi:hypothetical protein